MEFRADHGIRRRSCQRDDGAFFSFTSVIGAEFHDRRGIP
jgi:hypothetical protein